MTDELRLARVRALLGAAANLTNDDVHAFLAQTDRPVPQKTREDYQRERLEAEAQVRAGRHQARVLLFNANGKYKYEEHWQTPSDAIGPYDLLRSPDFRRTQGGAVLVETQEPWGFPHLFPGQPS